MKAVLFHTHGGPEVLEYTDFSLPEPGPGQVLVQLKAAALNRLDLWVRQGWPNIRLAYPHIPGADGAGVISAIGAGVTRFEVGDRVVINGNLSDGTCEFCQAGQDNRCVKWGLLGETTRGTYAEYVVIPERNVLKLPDHYPFDQAAAAALVFLTAWHSLVTRGQLQAGERVLIVGAGGGVNLASLQIAKYLGAQVMVVGSNAEKLRRAGRPVLLVVNKLDDAMHDHALHEFHRLGFGQPEPVSASVGTRSGDLLDAIVARLPPAADDEAVAAAVHMLGAIPNASMAEMVFPAHALMAELVKEPLVVDSSGNITLSDRPGLGLELDPRVVAKYRVDG